MTLDEIPNDITRKTPSCFEPTHRLRRRQNSEVAVREISGQRNHAHHADEIRRRSDGHRPHVSGSAVQGIRSLEPSTAWRAPAEVTTALLREKLHVPGPDRIHWLFEALERGMTRDEVCSLTKIDPWFIRQMEDMVALDRRVAASSLRGISRELLLESKRSGASDEELAKLWNVKSASVPRPPPRTRRHPGLQTRGHLRGGIRILHAVPLFDVRGRGRIRRGRPPQGRHPRQRPEPHRAGNRIRLLLLPRRRSRSRKTVTRP